MTINYARENVIDFTKPFMNLGIGILFKVSLFATRIAKIAKVKGAMNVNKIGMTYI
jgi:hypothetical protein